MTRDKQLWRAAWGGFKRGLGEASLYLLLGLVCLVAMSLVAMVGFAAGFFLGSLP